MSETPMTLAEKALARYKVDCETRARQDRAREDADREHERRAFGWALARALELQYDQTAQYPDLCFPGAIEDHRDAGGWLAYIQDGLRFLPLEHYGEDRVALAVPCVQCQDLTPGPIFEGLAALGERLSKPQEATCPACEEKRRQAQRDRAAEETALAPPPPASTLEQALMALTKFITSEVDDRLDRHAEAEEAREYYRTEREERRQKAHADELRRLRDQHESETYRLESKISELKRQTGRGW
jgi:hypothetical protein